MRIEQTEVDGVRVLWADAGPGQTVGALSFGVGRVDETAATAGISHLVEHLALASFGTQDFDHNAFVDATRTVIHAAGTDAQDRAEAIAAIDAAVPAELVACDEHGIGALAEPKDAA